MEGDPSQVLFVEDGHMLNTRLGRRYMQIERIESEYAMPLMECHWDQKLTYHISMPQFSLLQDCLEDKMQVARFFTTLQDQIRNGHTFPANGPFKVYLLIGGFDAAVMKDKHLPLSHFTNALVTFCEQLHRIFPLATICWLGSGSWHTIVRNEDYQVMIMEAMYHFEKLKPHYQSFDCTLDATSFDFSGSSNFWNAQYMNKQIYKLRKLFAMTSQSNMHMEVIQELNQTLNPLNVKLPYLQPRQIIVNMPMAVNTGRILIPQDSISDTSDVETSNALYPMGIETPPFPHTAMVNLPPSNLKFKSTLWKRRTPKIEIKDEKVTA
jgi:hypothetical protein